MKKLFATGLWSPRLFRTGNWAGVARGTLPQDRFAGANGEPLANHALDTGGTWTIDTGEWTLDGDGHVVQGNPLGNIASTEGDSANSRTFATVNVPVGVPDSAVGVLARLDAGSQNGWLAWIDVVDGALSLSERISGFFTLRHSVPLTLSFDRDYVVILDYLDDLFTVTLNGITSFTYNSSANIFNTRVGIYGDTAVGQRVSGFNVTAVVPSVPVSRIALTWSA